MQQNGKSVTEVPKELSVIVIVNEYSCELVFSLCRNQYFSNGKENLISINKRCHIDAFWITTNIQIKFCCIGFEFKCRGFHL